MESNSLQFTQSDATPPAPYVQPGLQYGVQTYAQPNIQPYQQPYQQQPAKQPKGWGRLLGAFGFAFLVLIVQTIAFIVGMISRSDQGMMTVGEIGGGIAAMLFIVVLGGKKLVVPSLAGMGEAWRILRWIFLVDAVITVVDIIGTAVDGSFSLAELWPLRLIMLALMCAGIGLFEEAMFRGLIFHGLLARMGTTKRGIFWAVFISSVLFGLAHLDPTTISLSDPSLVAQAVLKVAQTGIFGFVSAVVVLKTESIWPVALIHALNDFMLMFVFNGLMSEPVSTEYVTSGEEGLLAIGLYIALCVAYIPSLVAAVRTLRNHKAPDRGLFYRYGQNTTQRPVYQVPVVQVPAYQTPAGQMPNQQVPTYQASNQQISTYPAPDQHMPVHQAPAYNPSAYQAPVHQSPAHAAATYQEPARPTTPNPDPQQPPR